MARILGISAYYHDSAAALLVDGSLVSAAQEERFSRRKHDAGFPANAVRYCLEEATLGLADLDFIAFYDKPLVKFERLLETYVACAPRGFRSFVAAMPVWLRDKLYLKTVLARELGSLAGTGQAALPPLLFAEHHQSHAASAFFPSPFERAAVLCMDGVGEWATTTVWDGDGNRLEPLWQIDFPHSLGLLYSAFTYFTGFKVNSGEYKLMGLAPYGEPVHAARIREHLVDVKADGTFRLNMDYFDYTSGLRMTNERFATLFGRPPRRPESELTRDDMDIAASIQAVTEDIVLRLGATIGRETGHRHLCLAGGVALNCVANGRLLREGPFADIWIQPAAGDAGGAIGAAFATWHQYLERPRTAAGGDAMSGSLLGPAYNDLSVGDALEGLGAVHQRIDDDDLADFAARLLDEGNVVGWFQGRMEFGPRALGSRSILGDPRRPDMQSVMNLKIKYRESFRPFAPAVLAEHASACFELDRPSPYMLIVAPIRDALRRPPPAGEPVPTGIERLRLPRSTLPAVTHVDLSARVQTVDAGTSPRFHRLLRAFHERTGCPVLINTSFNVRGEPIVCTPEDAYRCFMRTQMDWLVIGNHVLDKRRQPPWREDGDWRRSLDPD